MQDINSLSRGGQSWPKPGATYYHALTYKDSRQTSCNPYGMVVCNGCNVIAKPSGPRFLKPGLKSYDSRLLLYENFVLVLLL